jgi:mRNA interferase MazF
MKGMPFMTNYNFGEIVLVAFPQHKGTIKKRPALVVLDIGDADIVLAPITTTKRTAPGDYELRDCSSESGLLKKSWVRLAKVSCLEKSAIVHSLGLISNNDLSQIIDIWQKLYPQK